MERTREAMKNMYNALKNMLPPAIKRSNKQIDEEGNQEYWMRLKKNLPKIQTSFPSAIIKRITDIKQKEEFSENSIHFFDNCNVCKTKCYK